MKVDFIDDDNFIIYYTSYKDLRGEEELKNLFKMLNNRLKKLYNYEFHGYYNVLIYVCKNIYVMCFENIDDFGRADFNITMLFNSSLLYELDDLDLAKGNMLYYDGKFYIDLEDVFDDIYLFERGNIIYGDLVESILSRGKFITI